MQELTEQTRQVLAGEQTQPHVYPHQIAFNLLPQVDVFLGSGYTKEEWKIINETRKIMHEPELPVSATCVRVPVYVGPLGGRARRVHEADDAGGLLRIVHDAPGVTVQDEPSVNLYPTPWTVAGQDDTYVGRIRQDASHPKRHRLLAGQRQPAQGRRAQRHPDRRRAGRPRAGLAPRGSGRSYSALQRVQKPLELTFFGGIDKL